MNRSLLLKLAASFLFLVLVVIGFRLASAKPLWNDEIYSQAASISKLSYLDIILGKVSEGNACPLFYIIQKAISDVSGIKGAVYWIASKGPLWDPQAQIILRINPVFFMSLSIVIIFYYFSRFHSVAEGVLSLAVSLSSYMVWLYWAEARHYALWFFFTAAQSLLFLYIMKQKKSYDRAWMWLTVLHVLFSFTVVLGLGQIFIISALLWIFKERRWKKYILLTALPVLIGLFYFTQSPKYSYYFACGIMQLVYPCIPAEYMIIFVGYALAFLAFWYCKRKGCAKVYVYSSEWSGKFYFIFTALILVFAFAVLGYLKLNESAPGQGFEIPMRYFIFLTPVGIIAVTLFCADIINAFRKDAWMLSNVIVGLCGLLIISFFRNCFWAVGLY